MARPIETRLMRHTNLYCPTCRQTTLFVEQVTFFECQSCRKQMMKSISPLTTIERRPPPPPSR
jgi:hypothetical protein